MPRHGKLLSPFIKGQDQAPWADNYNNKIDKYITNYKRCGIQLKGADKVIPFIEANRYLLANRPQTFQHGNYHGRSLIGLLGVHV